MGTNNSKNIIKKREINKQITLDDITLKDTIVFIPKFDKAKVISVYDGDTVTVGVIIDNVAYRFKVRLLGIQCPEIKLDYNKVTSEEKEIAIKARDYLASVILHKCVTLDIKGYEKYGRLLATVMLDDVCINDLMIEKRYAVAYDEPVPKSWKQYNEKIDEKT